MTPITSTLKVDSIRRPGGILLAALVSEPSAHKNDWGITAQSQIFLSIPENIPMDALAQNDELTITIERKADPDAPKVEVDKSLEAQQADNAILQKQLTDALNDKAAALAQLDEANKELESIRQTVSNSIHSTAPAPIPSAEPEPLPAISIPPESKPEGEIATAH